VDKESTGTERSRASSLPVRPTGTDAAFCDGKSVDSDGENGPSLVVPTVSSGVAPVSVELNGVAMWGRSSTAELEKNDPPDLRKSSCLRRRLTKAMAPTTRIKTAMPPATPPAIAPVCDVAFDDDDDDVTLTVIWTTGAVRANGAYIAPCAGLATPRTVDP